MFERLMKKSLHMAIGGLTLFGLAACGGTEEKPTETTSDFKGWTLEDLTDDQGFMIRIPEFDVPAGEEAQDCWFMEAPDLNNGQPYWINRVLSAINPGAHHMNIFRVKTILHLDPTMGEPVKLGKYDATVVHGYSNPATAECWKSANWADWPLVANSQNSEPDNPYTDWKLPTGVATKMAPGEKIMIQTHYVNATRQRTPNKAHVGVNMYLYKDAAEPIELGTLFATQQSIRICRSNPTPKFAGTCRFPQGDVTITAANGHFHSRGHKFTMFSWDGRTTTEPPESAKFYESDHWDDPPMTTDLQVKPGQGGGVWWNCEYQWYEPEFGCAAVDAKDPEQANDCCFVFGGNTDVAEHCNVFMYYYPRVAATDVFCN